MALTPAQQTAILFKQSQGKGSSDQTRQYYEEPLKSPPIVLPSQVWNQASSIPNTAPGGTDGQVTGVVTRYLARQLTAIAGTFAGSNGSFQLAIFQNTIPFYFGDGTSYNYALTDYLGNAIPFGTNDWVFDDASGTLTFYNGLPANVSQANPPKFSAYTYTGTLGVGGGGGGTVTSASVVSANGLAGTVATATTTPAITLSTTVTGIVKGNGTALTAATSGTDYAPGTAALATGILKSTTATGALTTAVAADFPTLNQSTTGNAATATTAGSATSFTGSLAGDVTGTQSATVVQKINGTALSGLATGILKNTTSTGVPSIAVAADFPTLNQSTTGNAATATTATTAGSATNFTGSLAGDVTGTQGATVLGSVNTSGAGTYGSATQVPVVTLDAKGRVTAVTNTTITAGGSTGGGGNLNTNPNGLTGATDWTGINNQIGVSVVSSTFLSAPGYSSNFQLNQNDPVQFFATGGTIISPLVAGTTYYANVSSGALANVSASPGGAAISGYSAGTGSTFLYQARPNSINPAYAPNTQTDFAIAASSPAGSGFTVSKGTGNDFGFNLEKLVTLTSTYDLLHPLVVSLDYDTATANTYVAGSIVWWLQEISTGNVVQLTSLVIPANAKGSLTQQFIPSAYFTTAALKLIGRWSTQSTTAQSLKLGNISYQPNYGLPVAVSQTVPNALTQINGFNFATGSTATQIFSLASNTYINNAGSALQYLDDAVNGARFTVLQAGFFTFEASFVQGGSSGGWGLSKNSANLTTAFSSLPKSEQLAAGISATSTVNNASWSGPLAIGDIVRIHNAGVTGFASTSYSTFAASFVGYVQTISGALNQTITLPTSEVTFNDASARGSTDTAIVKYTNMTNLRGDGFTITNTAANGTVITMVRAGEVFIGASVFAGTNVFISRNQATLTAVPLASEILATGNSASDRGFTSWTGMVAAGDKIRISTSATPTSNTTGNFLQVSFSDTNINVALNTVQPQWSQGDSAVDLQGGNGYGSTSTAVRRFSSVILNAGTDITYADSATLGATFTVVTAGTYSFSWFAESNSTGAPNLLLTLNQASGTTVATSEILDGSQCGNATTPSYAGASVTRYFNAGDIVRAASTVAPTQLTADRFIVSKIGKPNLTALTGFATVALTGKTTDLVSVPGSSGAVQYNNAGVIGGASSVGIESGGHLSLTALAPTASSPSVSASGKMTLYGRKRAGRTIISWLDENNDSTQIQPHLAFNSVRTSRAIGGVAAPSSYGLNIFTTGTNTAVTSATTNLFNSTPKTGYVTAATAGSIAGWRHGNSSAYPFMFGQVGYYCVIRFGIIATTATQATFTGLESTTAVYATGDPATTVPNRIGIGAGTSDTNLQIIVRGVGSATKVDLGSNFPAIGTANTDFYELRLYQPAGVSSVYYYVERLNTGDKADGVVSTNLPALTFGLTPSGQISNETTASAASYGFVSVYVESDY